MIDYILRKTEGGDIEPCDSCGCEVATSGFSWGSPHTEEHETDERYLCEFCASSYVGNITRYKARDSEGYLRREFAVTIAQAVNHILSKVKP